MLTRKAVDEQLGDADLVIRPDVGHFGTMAFGDAAEIIELGAAAAREKEDELRRWALASGSARETVEARRPPPGKPWTLDFVRYEGNERVDDRIVEARLRIAPGDVLDFDALAEDVAELYGLGDFKLIDYTFEEEDGERGVVLGMREKPWGPNYLHFGLFFASDADGETDLSLLLNLTATRLNARGGEWRNDFKIGRERRISSELYQPLNFVGHWFVAPSFDFERNRVGFFHEGREAAEFDVRRVTVSVDVGYQVGKYGELRLGLERSRADVQVATGSLPDEVVGDLDLDKLDFGALVFEATADRLDNSRIPRDGSFATLFAAFSHESLGADEDYSKLELSLARFLSRGRHTFLGTVRYGWSPGGELPTSDEFTLGGFLSLSGFAEDELRGQYVGVARLGYYLPGGGEELLERKSKLRWVE